jgi:hypothetical protein
VAESRNSIARAVPTRLSTNLNADEKDYTGLIFLTAQEGETENCCFSIITLDMEVAGVYNEGELRGNDGK